MRLPGGRCSGPSCREGDTDPGSPPTPVGPSTALGTPPDPRSRYFNELPGGFNKRRGLSTMKTGLCGLLLQRFHETQKARPCLLVGLLGFQWLKLLSPGPPQGRPLASPLHFTWLRPRQHLALESRRPRCKGGRQRPRSLLRRQSHPDTCPPHSAGSFKNPDSTPTPLPGSSRPFSRTEGHLHTPSISRGDKTEAQSKEIKRIQRPHDNGVIFFLNKAPALIPNKLSLSPTDSLDPRPGLSPRATGTSGDAAGLEAGALSASRL